MNNTIKNFMVALGAIGASASLDNKVNAQYSIYSQPQNQSTQIKVIEDGLDYALGLDYKRRETQWQVEIDMEKYPKEAKNLEQMAKEGNERISNTGRNQVSIVGRDEPKYEEFKLSNRFDINDFVEAYGKGKWEVCLSPNDKAKTERAFANWSVRDRSITCSLYYNPYGFFKQYFSAEGKQKFPEFNNAYKYIVEDAELSQQLTPFNELFYTSPTLASEVNKVYPWIKLDRADIPLNVPDRLLVLWIGDHMERNGKSVFNWNKIREYSNRYMQPQEMPKIPDFEKMRDSFPLKEPSTRPLIPEPPAPPVPVVPEIRTGKEF